MSLEYPDNLKPWVRWCVNHSLSWVIKGMIFMLYPVYLSYYFKAAFEDMLRDISNIK